MALVFNGTSHYLSAPYTTALAGSSSMTLCAWIKPTVVTRGKIVGRHDPMDTANSLFTLELSNGAVRMGFSRVTFWFWTSMTYATGGTITAGRWTHVAGTWDGSTISIYVNGVRVATANYSDAMVTGSTPLSIGAHFNGSSASNYFSGEIEDVRQYNRTLSSNEILTMYTVGGRDAILNNIVFQLPLQGGVVRRVLAANEVISDMGPGRVAFTNRVAGITAGSIISTIRN